MARQRLPTKGAILVRAAILNVAAATRSPPPEVLDGLKAGARVLHAAFRTALAEQIASIVSSDDGLVELHLFGSSAGYECGPSSDIDILVQVEEGSDHLVHTLRRLDRETTQEFRELLGGSVRRGTLLDIHVVTRADVEQRNGFAAILTSLDIERMRLRPLVSGRSSVYAKGAPA